MTRTFLHQDIAGGRWIPPWLRFQQATRYSWVSSFVKRKRVLEVGCGSGAGCNEILSAGASEVTGVDVDREAVQFARVRFDSPHIKFDVVQDSKLPVSDASFDVVIALETIEHVEHDQLFVEELARVLRSGGTLLLSTPNRLITNPGTTITDSPLNPLHVREYTKQELGELLSDSFEPPEWLGQTFYSRWLTALLTTIGKRASSVAVRMRQAVRVVLSPLDSQKRHQPRAWITGREPEVLVLKCRKRDDDAKGGPGDG